jgi:hypothetical protein
VKLSQANPTTSQANPRHTFELPPSAFAICSTQPSNVADAAADGLRFDVCNLAEDLDVHWQGIKPNVMATFKVEHALTRGLIFAIVSRRVFNKF